jgi:NDP-4-keto-2,6-dideoxyhexose 3-C-methyltransferase
MVVPIVATDRLCRTCRGPLSPVLDLGILDLPRFPLPGDPPSPRAPLDLRVCDTCSLVQLAHTVAPDLLYRQYWYRSSINEAMRQELTSIVGAALLEVSVYPQDIVIDVGANDGYLLSQYPKQRAHWQAGRIAIEPAQNLKDACAAHCEVLIPDYFPPRDGSQLQHIAGRVKILTSIAMFYGLDDPTQFVRAVDQVLHPDGVWILQLQDLAQMIETTAFDNICHEHLTYWSLSAFLWFLESCSVDLQVTHVERRAINGGSLRIVVRRRTFPIQSSVDELRVAELGSIGWQALGSFAWRVDEVRKQIASLIDGLQTYGIDLYGASTKGLTLLQVCGLGPAQIRQAWERNPEKYGRTANGIPIVSEIRGRENPPSLLLAGIWQFREALLTRETEYLDQGGRILFPLPEVDIVSHGRPDPV